MNKKLLIGAALLGAGVFAYKAYKKGATPTTPPTPSPNVGSPPIAASENELRDRLKRAGASLLEITRQVYAWKQAKQAKTTKGKNTGVANPPKFSMTNPTYNA
jgi:hypothetical protein